VFKLTFFIRNWSLLSDTLPKQIYWEISYFLHDPDIRARDHEYAKMQNDKMRKIISELKSGAISFLNTAEQGAAANP
jgi:hypothetical protein